MTPGAVPTAPPDESRLVALEAGRGVAAFIVLFHHILLAFAPSVKAALASTALGWAQNGGGAVIFFFTLSGFVLTFRTFQRGDARRVVLDAIKRWPRLWLAPAVSVVLGVLVLILHLNANQEAAAISGSDWLKTFGNAHLPDGFHPDLMDALRQSITLWFGANAGYNSSLWTMQWELMGSFLVFALAALLVRRAMPIAVGAFVIVAVGLSPLLPYMVPFVFGCGLAYVMAHGVKRIGIVGGTVLILMGLLLLSYEEPIRLFAPLSPLSDLGRQIVGTWLQTLGAVALIIGLRSELEPALSGRVARWLGQMSFPVYLVQVIAICTLGSTVFVWTADAGLVLQFAITAVACLVVTIVLALPFAIIDTWWRQRVTAAAHRYAGGLVRSPA